MAVAFTSLENGFTAHVLTENAMTTRFVSRDPDVVLYTETQTPRFDKCALDDVTHCPGWAAESSVACWPSR